MGRHFKFVVFLLVVWIFNSAGMCTKVVAYGTDTVTEPVASSYSSNVYTVFDTAKKSLEQMGYQITSADMVNNRIITGWRPVTADSHYLMLFGRPDYAANDGAYYQITADVTEADNKVNLTVFSTVKSMAGKLTSSRVVEKKILKQVDDLMRSPQIEMTNVGVTGR